MQKEPSPKSDRYLRGARVGRFAEYALGCHVFSWSAIHVKSHFDFAMVVAVAFFIFAHGCPNNFKEASYV